MEMKGNTYEGVVIRHLFVNDWQDDNVQMKGRRTAARRIDGRIRKEKRVITANVKEEVTVPLP